MSKKQAVQTVQTTWECWRYDVWGNARDGYDVNDRSCFDRCAVVDLRVVLKNPGTDIAFLSAYPSDAQIRRIFGLGRMKIKTDGDDVSVYVNRARDDYPIGEMFCTSHESLSPIHERQEIP